MRRLFPFAVLAASACAGAESGDPRIATAHVATTPKGSNACESCHASIADEWRRSHHRTAFSDATFQRSLALEEVSARAFCVGCHAPEEKTSGVAAGVGCVSCHGEAPRTADPTAPSRSPHPVTVDAAFATQRACAACHQFAFDDGRPDLVQKTLDEHAASGFANVTCATCHMPARKAAGQRSHADHAFPSGHSPDWLRKSVEVSATRFGDRVRVAIRSTAGHAFPTGDMFRRARLLVFGEARSGAIVASEELSFGRTWGGVRGGEYDGMRRELSDNRIRGHFEKEIRLEATAPIAKIRYVLLFERILAMRGPDAADVTLESSDVLAEGEAQSSSASER